MLRKLFMSILLPGLEAVASRVERVGPHFLIQGDAAEVLPFITGIDVAVLDPPYALGVASMPAGQKGRTFGWADVINGWGFFHELLSGVRGAMGDSGLIWQFMNWRTLPAAMRGAFAADVPFRSVVTWDKKCIGPCIW